MYFSGGFLHSAGISISKVFTYRRFTLSWVTVKVAWVTFWLRFNNFLWISYWCYAKYLGTTKSGSYSPDYTNFWLIFNTLFISSHANFSTVFQIAISIYPKKYPMVFWSLVHQKILKKISGDVGQYEFFLRKKTSLFH